MFYTARRLLIFLSLTFGLCGSAVAEWSARIGIEDFLWREYDSGGAQLLKESGPRLRLGIDWRHRFASEAQFMLDVHGSGYFGVVDYDGQACTISTGTCVPYKSDTEYNGLQAQALLVRRFGRAAGGELLAGGGIDYWRREIRGDSNVSGAREDWTVFNLMAGGGAYWGAASARYNLRFGAKFPLYVFETTDFADVTLRPEGKISPFARFTVDVHAAGRPRWGLGLYYDSYRFEESDRERVGSIVIWQPDSHQDVLGAYGVIYWR